MGLIKRSTLATLAVLVMGIAGCQPADDAELMSPGNDIFMTSPAP